MLCAVIYTNFKILFNAEFSGSGDQSRRKTSQISSFSRHQWDICSIAKIRCRLYSVYLVISVSTVGYGDRCHSKSDVTNCWIQMGFKHMVIHSGVKSSPEIYLSKSIVTDGGNYLK